MYFIPLIMQSICTIFYDVFDGLYGKGTSGKMFGKINSVDQCVKAFKQLIDMMNDYSKTLKSMQLVRANVQKSKSKIK